MHKALHILTLSSIPQISNIASFLGIKMYLRAKCLIGRHNRLVVASEDFALFLWERQFCDVLLASLSSVHATSR